MEFNRVETTTRAPFNKCYLCGDHAGPFIDTFFEQFGHGAVFLCGPSFTAEGVEVKPGCIGNMARKFGWLSDHDVAHLREVIAAQEVEITQLKSREMQVVMSEGDLRKVFGSEKKAKSADLFEAQMVKGE